jgi:hypothetical protein
MERRYLRNLVRSNAQLEEFEKIAGISPWVGRLGGAAAGSLAGGLIGSRTGQDPSTGAVQGAIYGGLAGLAGGQFLTGAGQRQAQRFGQRQLHGVTGYMPGRGLVGRGPEGTKWYRLGEKGPALTRAQRTAKLKQMKWTMPKAEELTESGQRAAMGGGTIMGPITRTLSKTETGDKLVGAAARHKARVAKAQQQVIDSGMTSVPGAVKAYTGRTAGITPLQAAKANLLAPGLAVGVGLPAASMAQTGVDYARTGDESALGRALAENVGFGLIGGVPMLPSMMAGSLIGRGGQAVGAGAGRIGSAISGSGAVPPTRVVPRQ